MLAGAMADVKQQEGGSAPRNEGQDGGAAMGEAVRLTRELLGAEDIGHGGPTWLVVRKDGSVARICFIHLAQAEVWILDSSKRGLEAGQYYDVGTSWGMENFRKVLGELAGARQQPRG